MDKIQTNINKKIKFSLLKVFEYKKTFNESDDPECAICYKLISNKVFVCEKPCGKTFHRDCLKTMIEHIEINTDEKIRPYYKCCYCRRKFNIHDYDLELFLQELLFLGNRGYNINDAILHSTFNASNRSETDICDEVEYSVYFPMDTCYIKTPKLAKRAEFKNKHKHKRSHTQLQIRKHNHKDKR